MMWLGWLCPCRTRGSSYRCRRDQTVVFMADASVAARHELYEAPISMTVVAARKATLIERDRFA